MEALKKVSLECMNKKSFSFDYLKYRYIGDFRDSNVKHYNDLAVKQYTKGL